MELNNRERRKKYKAKNGDVFTIRLDEEKICFGQIIRVAQYHDFIIIFDVVSGDIVDLAELPKAKIIIFAKSVDACIADGEWKIIGNIPVREDIVFPVYKLELSSGARVTDHLGKDLRSATSEEVKKLKNLTSWSPYTIEHAAKAILGDRDWESFYGDLIYLNSKVWVEGTY